MDDYKKKKHRTSLNSKSKKDFDNSFEIEVNSKNKTQRRKPVVIKGKKENKISRIKVLLSVCALIFVAVLIAFLVFPVGIIETFLDFTSSIGSGEYPIELSGSNVLNVAPDDNYYYVLTDLNLYSFSNSGKEISKENHGFSNPVLKKSQTRALVYDQGQKNYYVYTSAKMLFSKQTKFDIISADICDAGYMALATHSDSYKSSVSVFDKNNKSVFTWNCAKETINAVSLSPSGKRLALSTISAKNGELSSKVYIFDINKTDSQKSFEYSETSVYSLYSNRKGVFVVTDSNYDFYYWKSDDCKKSSTELSVDFFRNDRGGPIAVLNRKNDRSDNTIVILSKKGEKLQSFTYNGNISDIRKNGSHIYIIGDAKIDMFDLKGNFVSSADCSHDFRYIVASGSRTVNIVSDNTVNQIYIK